MSSIGKQGREAAGSFMNRTTLLWVLVCFSVPGSAMPQDMQRSMPDTLAVIGQKAITSDQFARAFRERVLGTGLPDNGETRRGYLSNLVDDEVLIAQARKNGLDRTPEGLRELRRIRLQELLNAYAEKHVFGHVEVTESDLQEFFWRMNTKVKVRHLYAQTREEADSLYAEVSRGRDFEGMARKVFRDPHMRESGGSLGYVSVDEMDPAFEHAMYVMRPGEISRPVKTVYGYSIINVEDIQRNPFVTESEFLVAKDRIRAFVHRQKNEDAAAEHVALLRAKLGVRFNGDLLARVYASTQHASLRTPVEHQSTAISAGDRQTWLVASTLGRWSAGCVIDAMRETPEGQRKWIRTRENLEDFIAGLVVREHMSKLAAKEHLDGGIAYQEKIQHADDTYLLTTLEAQLRKEIRIAPDSVQAYYQRNTDRFTAKPEVRLRGILLDSAGTSDSLAYLLEHGGDFAQLARQFSVQRATAEHGGDMGRFTREQLGRFGSDIFAMEPGEWKGPLVQEGKYLFVQCGGAVEAKVKPLQEVSQEIESILVTTAWQAERRRHVDSLKSVVRCRIYPERLMTMSLNN